MNVRINVIPHTLRPEWAWEITDTTGALMASGDDVYSTRIEAREAALDYTDAQGYNVVGVRELSVQNVRARLVIAA